MLFFINHDDLRGQELMEELVRRHYYVTDQMKDLRYCQCIYLGLKGLDRKNRLLLHDETIVMNEDVFKQLRPHTYIWTMIHNSYLEELSHQYHFQYSAFLDDETFVENNGFLTAEGVISYLISHRRFPIFQSQIHVLGYGHCGKPMVKDLIALQGDVYVGVRNPQLLNDIQNIGGHPYLLEDMDLSQCDILINTIPSQVVKPKILDQAKSSICLIDIASYPYGIDHHYALSKGMSSVILPSIPGKYAYGYAGMMMADLIERMISRA